MPKTIKPTKTMKKVLDTLNEEGKQKYLEYMKKVKAGVKTEFFVNNLKFN